MARLVWALFCEHHLTDASGKNSYIGVFDSMTISFRAEKGKPRPQEPLPGPVPSPAFVLALQLSTQPGSPECTARLKDPDGQQMLPEMSAKLQPNQYGKHSWHLHFPHGIPVRRSGTYVFEVDVADETMGRKEVELQITLDIR